MKYLNKIYFLLLSAVLIAGCDIVNEPYRQNAEPIDTTKVVKKVLIEDYTGFKCGNCPDAAVKAHEIYDIYPNNVIILAVHAGYYAKPDLPPSKYVYDFQTPEGNELNTYFKVNQNPIGMINRVKSNNVQLQNIANWASLTAVEIAKPVELKLGLTAEYDPTTRKITAKADLKYLNKASSKNYLCMYITEDKIIQYQKWYNHIPEMITDYEHNHVLRASMNTAWGELISNSAIANGTVFTKNYEYTISSDKDWKPENLKIIAYVYDRDQDDYVLQAETVNITIK